MPLRLPKHTLIVVCLGLLAALAVPSVSRADNRVAPGWDLFETQPGTMFGGVPFTGDPLGSFNFGGSIGTQPTGNTDTIVQRLAPATGPSTTIPIELVALHLMSAVPANFGLGVGAYFVTLQSERGGPASTGMQTINFGPEAPIHGTFDSLINVAFDIRLGSLSGPIALSDTLPLSSSGVPWGHDGTGHWRLTGVNYLLKGDGTINQDFFPVGLFQEQEPGAGIHVVGSSGPNAINSVAGAVPEPGSFVLLSLGVVGLVGYGWRRRQLAV